MGGNFMHRLRAVVRRSWRASADAGHRTSRPRLRVAVIAVLALAVAALSACGSSAVTSSNSAPSSAAASSAPAAPASSAAASSAPASSGSASGETDISAVPAGAKDSYTNYQLYSKLPERVPEL